MQVVTKIIFSIATLLLAVNALPVSQNVKLSKVPFAQSYGMVFDAIFNSGNLTASATTSVENDPCLAAFTVRNAAILATFGNATLACTNLTPTATSQFLSTTDADAYKKQFHGQMSGCGSNVNVDDTKKCYANVISSNLNIVSLATTGTPYDNTVCIVESAEIMVNDIGVSTDQLIACIDIEDEEGALGDTVPGQLGGLGTGIGSTGNSANGLGIPNIFAAIPNPVNQI